VCTCVSVRVHMSTPVRLHACVCACVYADMRVYARCNGEVGQDHTYKGKSSVCVCVCVCDDYSKKTSSAWFWPAIDSMFKHV